MGTTVKHFRLMPGAEVVEHGEGPSAERALIGIPPCLKLFFQRKLPAPTTFVLPEQFFQRGVIQVCLEFFVYYFLFVLGKAFGKLAPEAKLVVIGTPQQIARAQRMLSLTLFGPSAEEMQSWKRMTDGRMTRTMKRRTIERLRKYRAWFAPKQLGFRQLAEFIAAARSLEQPDLAIGECLQKLGIETPAPIVQEFLRVHGSLSVSDALLAAHEFGTLNLDDVIEWRPFDTFGRAALFTGVTIAQQINGTFLVTTGEEVLSVDPRVTEDQAQYLITLPPQSEPVEPETFRILCLGADSGFEVEHPTTGFAIAVNGQWVVVDAPVCATYLLRQYGINAADVRVIVETHAHEDHMGSAMHFLLDQLTAGRSFTYVAAEPVYRTCVAKVAAVLDRSEEDIDRLLAGGGNADAERVAAAPRGGVIILEPGKQLRLLGATWESAYTVHPIPTTGFRVTVEHEGQTYALAYSSDTAPTGGLTGTDAMAKAGLYDHEDDPFVALVRGDERLVLWEAGGTNGDPIHYDARSWPGMCAARDIEVPVVFMHVHPLPPELRKYALARPGWQHTLVRSAPVSIADAVAVGETLRQFPLRDPAYWNAILLRQGVLEQYAPGATIVAQGAVGDAWFLLLRGETEVRIGTTTVGRLGSNAFFGELALLDEDGRRKATVAAGAGPVTVLRVPAATFRDLVLAEDLTGMFDKYWQHVELLQQTRLFVGFPHAIVGRLAAEARRVQFPSGEVLIRQGTVGDELFVIESGEVRISKERADGETMVVGCRGPGEFLGEFGVLVPGGPRTATVRAITAVTALVLTHEQIAAVMAGQIPLQLRLIALARERGMPVPALGAQAA
ncbi:MAG: cyclic nucleotide-binding domain-containing protein [bacterium]|nr:cyclic nucleotide-binding domain-containing protein [bacterium]